MYTLCTREVPRPRLHLEKGWKAGLLQIPVQTIFKSRIFKKEGGEGGPIATTQQRGKLTPRSWGAKRRQASESSFHCSQEEYQTHWRDDESCGMSTGGGECLDVFSGSFPIFCISQPLRNQNAVATIASSHNFHYFSMFSWTKEPEREPS